MSIHLPDCLADVVFAILLYYVRYNVYILQIYTCILQERKAECILYIIIYMYRERGRERVNNDVYGTRRCAKSVFENNYKLVKYSTLLVYSSFEEVLDESFKICWIDFFFLVNYVFLLIVMFARDF